ncbi:SDR family oxidoreductase [Leucobacter sp. BZR 635]
MSIMIIGASRGLGLALADGLAAAGHRVVGVARTVPDGRAGWIAADLASPAAAARTIAEAAPEGLRTVVWNVGVWEHTAFTDAYVFAHAGASAAPGTAVDTAAADAEIETLIQTNVTAAILVLRRLLPRLLEHPNPRIIITGSTSGLRGSGRPEVAFGASKFAIHGIADALREGYREDQLGVTTLQLGYLNTDDGLDVPAGVAAQRGAGILVPVHDVVRIVQTILELSPAAFVRDLTLPAILDDRF